METLDPFSNQRIQNLIDRYQILTEFFDNYHLIRFNTTYIHLVSKQIRFDSRLKVHTAGVALFKDRQNVPKIMTSAAPCFTGYARQHILKVGDKDIEDYTRGNELQIKPDSKFESGYLLVEYQNRIIGSALLRRTENGTTIESQWPKQYRNIQLF